MVKLPFKHKTGMVSEGQFFVRILECNVKQEWISFFPPSFTSFSMTLALHEITQNIIREYGLV